MPPPVDMHQLNARLLRFRSDPEQEDALVLAEDLIAAERYGDARGVVVSAQTGDPGLDGRLLVLEGRAWYMDRDLVRAQAALVKAAKVDPQSADAYRWLAEVLLERGDAPRALKSLERAIAIAPLDADGQRLVERAQAKPVPARAAPPPEHPVAPLAPNAAPPLTLPRRPPPRVDAEPPRRASIATPLAAPPAIPSMAGVRAPGPNIGRQSLMRPITVPAVPPPAAGSLGSLAARPSRPSDEPLREGFVEAVQPAIAMPGAGAIAAAPEPDPQPMQEAAVPEALGKVFDTEPGTGHAPFTDWSEGTLDAVQAPSTAGVLAAPATVGGAAANSSHQGSLSSAEPPHESPEASPRTEPAQLDVDIELDEEPLPESVAAEPKVDTTPGLGAAPIGRRDETPATLWGTADGAAAWPATESFSTSAAIPPRPVPDLPLGATAGRAEDPDALLETLRQHGVFEPPAAKSPTWPARDEIPSAALPMKRALQRLWLAALLLFAGGYLGWQQWIAFRHAQSDQLVEQARLAIFDGDNAKLMEAERLLRTARDQHPRSTQVPKVEIVLHAERVLESGNRENSALRGSLGRARALHADAAYVAAGQAVLAAYSGDAAASDLLESAARQARGEPALLYLAGRLAQRLDRPEAQARLNAALAAAPQLVPASLALAELQDGLGRQPDALSTIETVLKRQPQHLRARLWRAYLMADAQPPTEALAQLAALAQQVRAAAPVDRILAAVAQARVLRRTGAVDAASAALRDALSAGASEGRLLAMVATEARREGAFGVAQQAATRAVQASPVSVAYRVLLASILVERSEGVPALTLLAGLPKDQLVLDVMRAKASLSADDHEAQRAALTALQAGPKHDAASVEITALRLRLQAALDPGEHLLREARSLLHRAPGDPESLRAVGEVALALHEPAEALSALESLCKLLPRDADAQHLLGRARRMSIDAPGAEVALRRALELVPDHQGALGTLAALQLDVGRYAAADDLYQRIAMRDPLTGRVGRAEALIGLGRLADAQSQLSGLPENQRGIDIVREVGARVALAAHHPGEALTLLRPLVEGEDRRSTTFVVYGDALFAADQVDAAAGAYDAALGIDPELPEALLGRAEVQLRAQRFKEALEFLDRAKVAVPTRLRPPSVRVRMLTLYGHTYVDRAKHGDYAVARDLLREAVQDPSVPPDAHFWLGEALGGRKTAESAAALKRYLELQPEGPYAARAKKALGPLL